MIKLWSKFQSQILWHSFTRDHSFLLNPFPSLPKEDHALSVSRHMNSSLNVYLFLVSGLQLGKSKKFNNQEMKVQVKRALKSYFFCHQNSNKKEERLYMKFSSPPNTSVKSSIWDQLPIFCCHFFFEENINPQVRINKMGNEHCRLPP